MVWGVQQQQKKPKKPNPPRPYTQLIKMDSSSSKNRTASITPTLMVLLHCLAQTSMAHATSSSAHSLAAFASPSAWIHPTTRIDLLRLGMQETGINRRNIRRGHGMIRNMPAASRHCRNNMPASFVSSLSSCMASRAQGSPAADLELPGGRRNVKAVFTDVDGTLLGSDHQVLSQNNNSSLQTYSTATNSCIIISPSSICE